MDCSTKSQYIISKNIIPSKENADMFDIKPLLELLNVNNDVNVQVKLFSTLSAYIMTNEGCKDKIITYNFLYDKMCTLLSNCSPRRATVTLNFLSALLYVGDEDSGRRKSLIAYAKNMIRSSGCLASMCDLFTSCMLHQDVWRSLCRCLAETCHGVEENQSYCTHLVPMCIQRCSQRNIEVFSVLQSLLQNHTRNINLFIECNGISLFQREYLQHHDCLQLLSILVQSSSEAVRAIRESGISQTMRDFLRTYGPDTQLGQWATIILYYISEEKEKGGFEVIASVNEAANSKSIGEMINKTGAIDNLQCSTDTTKLLQNVMTEIMQCGPSDLKYLQELFPAQPVSNLLISQSNKIQIEQNCIQNEQPDISKTAKKNIPLKYNFLQRCQDKNVSIHRGRLGPNGTKNSLFSFIELQNHKICTNVTSFYNTAEKYTDSLQKDFDINEMNSVRPVDNTASLIINARQKTPDIHEFKPKFTSTPKQNNSSDNKELNTELFHNSTRRSTRRSIRKYEMKRRVEKKKIPRRHQQSKIDKENKHHRSISGWLFETINESCTTLVKTVRNIFRPKTSLEETKSKSLSPISNSNSSSCSFSFTNYMRRRDAILEKECTNRSRAGLDDNTMEWSNSCNTCNDTVALKRKLANDEFLKQTIRKLKLGINLYGCDFKKISKQLWPQQTYMTPVVLYNLYRKLILK